MSLEALALSLAALVELAALLAADEALEEPQPANASVPNPMDMTRSRAITGRRTVFIMFSHLELEFSQVGLMIAKFAHS